MLISQGAPRWTSKKIFFKVERTIGDEKGVEKDVKGCCRAPRWYILLNLGDKECRWMIRGIRKDVKGH